MEQYTQEGKRWQAHKARTEALPLWRPRVGGRRDAGLQGDGRGQGRLGVQEVTGGEYVCHFDFTEENNQTL